MASSTTNPGPPETSRSLFNKKKRAFHNGGEGDGGKMDDSFFHHPPNDSETTQGEDPAGQGRLQEEAGTGTPAEQLNGCVVGPEGLFNPLIHLCEA